MLKQNMETIKKVILAIIALFFFTGAFSQGKTILRGRIIDKSDQTTIIGANVIEYDSDNRVINGTVSNVNGDFVLTMRDPSSTVKVSVIGYEPQEIPVDPSRTLIIELQPTTVDLEEVTVTATAKSSNTLINIDERDNATATVKIDLIDMQESGVISATDALQGKVSGLDIIAASGDPGSG